MLFSSQLNSDVAHGDNPHYRRIMEYPELEGTTRIIQSSSCIGHQESQMLVLVPSVFLGTFSPFGIVSAGTLPNPGNPPIL